MKKITLLIVPILFFSCQKVNTANFEEKLSWIEGRWISEQDPYYSEENWKWEKDRYSANGFMLNLGDTVFVEYLTIKAVEKDLFLTARVQDQNNNKEVFFKLISESSDSLLFENKRHNYPNYIEYVLESDNMIRAKAYGQINNQPREDVIYYSRAN